MLQTVAVEGYRSLRELPAAAADGIDVRDIHLVKEHGETLVDGQGLLDRPAWHWRRADTGRPTDPGQRAGT